MFILGVHLRCRASLPRCLTWRASRAEVFQHATKSLQCTPTEGKLAPSASSRVGSCQSCTCPHEQESRSRNASCRRTYNSIVRMTWMAEPSPTRLKRSERGRPKSASTSCPTTWQLARTLKNTSGVVRRKTPRARKALLRGCILGFRKFGERVSVLSPWRVAASLAAWFTAGAVADVKK